MVLFTFGLTKLARRPARLNTGAAQRSSEQRPVFLNGLSLSVKRRTRLTRGFVSNTNVAVQWARKVLDHVCVVEAQAAGAVSFM